MEIKGFNKILSKLEKINFDEYHQASVPNKFRKLNIIAVSNKLNRQYWICAERGYCTKDVFHISWCSLDDLKLKRNDTGRINCKNQTEVCKELDKIQVLITE